MGKKVVHHMDFDALAGVNKSVVALTGEPFGYSDADEEKLSSLITEVEARADNRSLDEAIPEKASLLVYKIASGQYFRSGNKRTALVAGLAFLMKNGYTMDIEDQTLVGTVDRVGMAAASLDDLFAAMGDLLKKRKTDRKKWEGVVSSIVDSNRDFLTGLGAKETP
jgi:prophage maintenance system killer protein